MDSLIWGRSAIPTGGNAITLHQYLRKPVKDQHELHEWLRLGTSDSLPWSEQTPSHFLLFKPQSFSHFSSCICFSPTSSCHPSSRPNCNSYTTLYTLLTPLRLPFHSSSIAFWIGKAYKHSLQLALGLRVINLPFRLPDAELTQCWN